MDVGVVGLGVMGSAMARHLAREGLLKAVWNRTASRATPIAEALGVSQAADLPDLARQCDVIITCVSADEDLLEVIEALVPALGSQHLLVDTSTVGVDTSEAISQKLEAVGARFVDAPVTGGAEGAEAGTLQVMAGGTETAVEAARPALLAFGSDVTHMGPVGYGQRAKAVNQVLVAGMVQAISEALAFADASGLEKEKLLPILTGGAAGSRLLERRGARILDNDFEPGFRMVLHHKDLHICRRLLQSLNVNLPLVEMTLKHYDALMAKGYGDEDTTALFRLKREMFETGNRKSL
ncbi:MAG: NAD(P)-dependent oxidoreductase [Spiribacter sp.]|nr:NAD(P)-dependent oxidoreductase [Spiribacter sp.]MDR9489640.1 NAD(P)-dependent oxidoreductase [Spiribacter sp.]